MFVELFLSVNLLLVETYDCAQENSKGIVENIIPNLFI